MTRRSNILVLTHAVLLAALALLVVILVRSRFYASINFDEEFFLWQGWAILNGNVPYRDFFEPKPPLIFFANALGLAVFGIKDSLYRIVPTAVAVASIALFYPALVARRIAPWLATLVTAQAALWLIGGEFHDSGLNDTETYGLALTLIGISLGAFAASRATGRGTLALQVLSGVSFGLAVLCKELFVLAVLPAWVLGAITPLDLKWNWRQLMMSAAGGLAVGFVFLGYLVLNSALGAYFDLIGFYRPLAANYCVDLGRFPRVSGWGVVTASWDKLREPLYNFRHLAFVIALYAAIPLLIRSGNGRLRLLQVGIASVAVVFGMIAVSAGHCFWKHYFLMGMAGLLLASTVGAEVLSQFLRDKPVSLSAAAAVILISALSFVMTPPLRVALEEPPKRHTYPWYYEPLLVETIERHSQPGDYILSTESPLLYVATNRKNPLPLGAFTDEILPYMAAENQTLQLDRLRQSLEANLPKVVYFASWLRPRQEKFHQLLFDPLLAKYGYVRVTDQIWHLPPAE